MALTEEQQHRIDGIVKHLNDFLDKRFSQARRINPKVGVVEADVRWHQVQTVREVLASSRGYGPLRIMVCDVLCSSDEPKKRDLFDPVNQSSIQNEIVPQKDESERQRRAGQLEIRDVKTFYSALDPSLEKIVVLLQTWLWWDLRDAADLHRFDVQVSRLRDLREAELDDNLLKYYKQEMRVRPGVELTKHEILAFELRRTREIVDAFRERRHEEHGYQVIVVSQECEGSTEANALCIRLAKRLMAIEKIKAQKSDLDAQVRQYYASQLGFSADLVTREAVLDFEQHQAARERQNLGEHLSSAARMGETVSDKASKLDAMDVRLNSLYTALNIGKPAAPSAAAPPDGESAQPGAEQIGQAAVHKPVEEPQFQIPSF
ncbi:hypothetical protein JW916_02790 [Candidatus Sumerlaeota bacterium]|nr:hypothetical protein [Candidatus Sumerlaeota bacterium]